MGSGGFFSKSKSRPPLTKAAERANLLDELESLGLGSFWSSDSEGKLNYLSPGILASLDCEPNAILGQPLNDIFVSDTLAENERGRRPLSFSINGHSALKERSVRVKPANTETWWVIAGEPQFDEKRNFLGYRGTLRDVTQTRMTEHDRNHAAQFDVLTGLANRARMQNELETTLNKVRLAERSCALMLLDLDRFKQVNDTLGHPAGDELLKQVAQRAKAIIKDRGEIGRIGGDEFQIVLTDMDDRGELAELAERLIQMISQPYSVEGSRAIIGTSIGMAIAPYDGIEAEELVSGADLALYAAKASGRGQYRFFAQDLRNVARSRRETEDDLRDALAREEFEMRYQPLVKAEDGCVSGFEALVRWNHPVRGDVSPEIFIPIAEDSGMIHDIGSWILESACTDAVNWPGELRVAVNVSVPQFMKPGFEQMVAGILRKTGLEPSRLELEITESVFMGDPESVSACIKGLKRLGVRLALDDFGTGYSSFGYLRKAPFDKIKVDQSFVRGSTEDDTNNAAIVTAIGSLAHALGMEAVAEGVETLDELDLVKKRGATHIQGYVYSPPVSHDEVLAKLETGDLSYKAVGPAHYRADRSSMFRQIGIIHGDHHYSAVMRNLSKTGARIDGLSGLSVGMEIVLDLGEGQLAVGTVKRVSEASFGMAFETPLIRNGVDGLCTRHRVSPYALASAGMPLAALPEGKYPLDMARGGAAPSGPRLLLEVETTPLAA